MLCTDKTIMHYLARKISNEVDKTVQSFFEHLADTNPDQFQVDELMTQWKSFTKTKPKKTTTGAPSRTTTKKDKKKKPSNYILFCKATRPTLKEKGLTFGEISKELGRLWKLMSAEERAKYTADSPEKTLSSESDETVESPPVVTSPASLPVASPVITKTTDNIVSPVINTMNKTVADDDKSNDISPIDFDKVLLPELKRMCKDRGLDIKKKKRSELIEMLKKTTGDDDDDDEEEDDYGKLLDSEEETLV